MNTLDFILIGVILIFTFRGLIRGLINEVFGFGSLIFSLFAAYWFFAPVSEKFAQTMNPLLSKILAFVAVFGVAFVVIKVIQMIVKAVFSGAILGSLDKALGVILGFLEGAALVLLILFVMKQVNGVVDSESLRNESVISNFISGIPV